LAKKRKKEKKNFEKDDHPQEKKVLSNNSLVSFAIFLFSISVVLISLISVIFPALLASTSYLPIPEVNIVEVNPYEYGVWSIPLFVANILVFLIAILYFKNKLPSSIINSFEYLFSFEISRRVAIIAMVIILGVYVTLSANELTVEEQWLDYKGIIERIETGSRTSPIIGFEPHVKLFLLSSSMEIFGNYAVIPFMASIALLILVYFITKEITSKRFAGMISMVILLQSNLFLTYDTTVSYSNFWILFYLFSLYSMYKIWPLSPVAYVLSILSKSITAMFLPLSLYFLYRAKISKKRKIVILVSTLAIVLIGIVIAFSMNIDLSGRAEFEGLDVNDFWIGFTSFAFQLRLDGLVILFILPLIVGLYLASKKGIKHAESIMVLISGMLIFAPILTGFTDQTNQPYRFVPLVVFFAIGVGVLLSKVSEKVELQSKLS